MELRQLKEVLHKLRRVTIPPPVHKEANRAKFLEEVEKMAAGTKEAKK